MGDAKSRLGVGVREAFVARLHAGRDVFGLPSLVAAVEGTVEDLEDEGAKLVSINGRVRAAL